MGVKKGVLYGVGVGPGGGPIGRHLGELGIPPFTSFPWAGRRGKLSWSFPEGRC